MKVLGLRRTWFAAIFSAAVLITGCGDTFRPVANPLPQQNGPDPLNSGVAIVLSNAGPAAQGVATTINLSGDSNVGQINLGVNTTFAITPDNFRVLATNAGDDTLSQYFPVTSPLGATTTVTTLVPGTAPVSVAVAINPGVGSFAYLASPSRNTLGVVTIGTNVELTEVQLAPTAHPVGAVPTPNGLKVYSLNNGDSTVSAISTQDNAILATFPVGAGPVAGVASSDGSSVYIVSQAGGSVARIDAVTDSVTTTIPVGTSPVTAVYSKRLQRLFVVNQGSNSVTVIDGDPNSPTKNTVLATVPVGTAPVSIALLPDGTRAYVANSGSNSVSVIDLVGNTVLRTVAVGNDPISIAASSDSRRVVVVNQNDNSASLIDTTSDQVSSTMPVPATPIMVVTTT